MALQNLNYLIEAGKKQDENRLLFEITILNQRFKCLFLTELFKFIIVAYPKSKGLIAHFNDKGEQVGSQFLPTDFYYAIYDTISKLDKDNKSPSPNVFWKEFDKEILNAKITSISNKEAYDILSTTSTTDIRLDQGNKPFFLSFYRHRVKRVAEKNLNKTEYYFGKENREMCKTNNISTRWTNDAVRSKIEVFFNPTLLEKEFNNILNPQTNQ
jgi:hypothetical protein